MKEKPILNESTVRKFMKLANLSKVGESFLSENFEEVEELEEDKHFGGSKDHKMSPAKAPKKVMNEEEMDMDMPEVPEVAPAEEPSEMGAEDLAQKIVDLLQGAGLIDVVDEEEGGEEEDMDMGDEEEEGEEEVEMEDEGSMYEEEDLEEALKAYKGHEGEGDEPEYTGTYKQYEKLKAKQKEEEEARRAAKKKEKEKTSETMYESKKRVARIVAERVMARIQKEEKIERLSETITKRVMERLSRG
jgi:hypothetical protein